MDEHDRSRHRTALLKRVPEIKIVIILQAHASENDQINLSLQCDTCKQFIVRLSRDREDRKLLRFNQCVEHVNHRDTGSDHPLGDNTLCRVYGRPCDINHVVIQLWAIVTRPAGTVKHTSHQRIRIAHAQGIAEETHAVAGTYALSAGKDLKRHKVPVQLDDVGIAFSCLCRHFRKVRILDARGTYSDYVADNALNFRINLLHNYDLTFAL